MTSVEEMKCSGLDWVTEVPTQWQVHQIKRTCSLVRGQFTHRPRNDPALYDGPYPFVQTGDITAAGKYILSYSQTLNELGLSVSKRFPRGTLVMSIAANIGDVAILDFEACFPDSMIGMIPSPKTNLDFLFYLMRAMRDIMLRSAVQSTQLNLNYVRIGTNFAAFPLLPEQQRIAAYLDTSYAAIDAAVAAKRRQLETLDELRHSNIYRAVTKGLDHSAALKESGIDWLGEMPSHWAIRRIKDIAELRSGDAIQSEDITPAGDYPVYGGNGLRGYTSSFTHDGQFVLIGRQGALCGNINYANGKFWATEHAVVVTQLRKFDILWLGELLRVMNLNQYSNAAAQPGLAVDRIKFLRLPLPPPEEQNRIAQYVKGIIQKTGRMTTHLQTQIATLTAYRKSLIHECVTGQRRISDADLTAVKRTEVDPPEPHQN